MTNKKNLKGQINFFSEIVLMDQDLLNKKPQVLEGIIKSDKDNECTTGPRPWSLLDENAWTHKPPSFFFFYI